MRKAQILAISLLVVLVLLVGAGAVACGGNGDENGVPPDNGGETVSPEDEEEPAGEIHFTSDDGKIELALVGVEKTKVWPSEMLGEGVPEEGYDFAVVNIEVVRIEDGHIKPSQGSTITDDNGAEYQVNLAWQGIQLVDPQDFANSDTELVEGAVGTFVAALPEDTQPVSLRLTYLFFESWTESWERVGEEERYIDISLD